ncbi:sensor histidine kinase [Pseudofulvibacter geojedonensis]|uniref:Sensor histidine kinase n=1 Tax=Pseudofulvibacter geojedonensis TaxID=1123758 RepID=A0ABW3I0A4_9FLAO
MSDYLWQTIVPLIFFSFIWMLFRNLEKQQEIETVKKEHTKMELKFLKSQINPHVLLNNLNTIYSYSLEKPNEVPELLLMLSDNLKHVLYNSNHTFVPLEEEIEFIDNYMAFQKLRTSGVKNIVYNTNINNLNLTIAPLLLITIIENAFKHSATNSDIVIEIETNSNTITLKCSNSFQQHKLKDSGQIGLENLKKRLALLYPKQHQLNISSEDLFIVKLEINLNSTE